MQETQVRFLGLEDPLEKWQPTPVFLPRKSHGQRSLAGYSPWGHKRVGHDLATKQHQPTNQSLGLVLVVSKGIKANLPGDGGQTSKASLRP